MIEDFIDSALIIDDQFKEIEALKAHLEAREILVKHYFPEDLKSEGPILKNRKIVFLDLFVEDNKNLKTNISIIRSIFSNRIGKDFGTYGLVVWTKHFEEIKELKRRMSNDGASYSLPLFIIGIEKNEYLQKGNFHSILADIDNKIKENVAASFFIEWDNLVKRSKENAIRGFFSLVKDYEKQDQDLRYVLYKLAQNYVGVPDNKLAGYNLEMDAFKAFSDVLHYEIAAENKTQLKIFENPQQISPSADINVQNIYAAINSKLLLDFSHTTQALVIPGNIYQVLSDESPFYLKDASTPADSIRIVIEITPPCDFSNGLTKKSRLISGFITAFSNNKKDSFKKEMYYKELWPVKVSDVIPCALVIFDFRYFGSIDESELIDENKYKLLFRTKDKLFADILQKLSAHTSRLGLSVIHK